ERADVVSENGRGVSLGVQADEDWLDSQRQRAKLVHRARHIGESNRAGVGTMRVSEVDHEPFAAEAQFRGGASASGVDQSEMTLDRTKRAPGAARGLQPTPLRRGRWRVSAPTALEPPAKFAAPLSLARFATFQRSPAG